MQNIPEPFGSGILFYAECFFGERGTRCVFLGGVERAVCFFGLGEI